MKHFILFLLFVSYSTFARTEQEMSEDLQQSFKQYLVVSEQLVKELESKSKDTIKLEKLMKEKKALAEHLDAVEAEHKSLNKGVK